MSTEHDIREVRSTLIACQRLAYVQRAIEAFDRLVVDLEWRHEARGLDRFPSETSLRAEMNGDV